MVKFTPVIMSVTGVFAVLNVGHRSSGEGYGWILGCSFRVLIFICGNGAMSYISMDCFLASKDLIVTLYATKTMENVLMQIKSTFC